ncbi:MAG: flavin reductase family protein [Dehalococcoidia bacterium]|nr:flavin reductase family protein [Dehalococcoidia bacterium]
MKIDPRAISARECYKLLIGSIVPRPIAWVSTVGEDGVDNVAPFSFFTSVCTYPPTVCFTAIRRAGEKKDTVRNIEYTGDFVINLVTEELAEAMNISCGDYLPEVDEFQVAGLTAIPGDKVRSPRVAESPISLECKLVQMIELGEGEHRTSVPFGEVVQFHIKDEFLHDGRIDMEMLQPVGRLAGDLYTKTRQIFEMKRPRVGR